MRIHRSKHTANFTVLPNSFLRDRRLSFTARGLLSYLLSHPESTRQDIKTLAADNPEGQAAVARAMRELIAHGYLTREHVRNAAGRISTLVNVYDTPQDGRQGVEQQVRPRLGKPRPGEPSALPTGVKKEEKETTPSRRRRAPDEPAWPARSPRDGREGSTSPDVAPDGSAPPGVALLARLGRTEPRLTVGGSEMGPVLPLVAEWLARGGSEAQIRTVLTVGLPDEIRSPAKLIVHRLRCKMPAVAPVTATVPRPLARAECDKCGRPVPTPGVCSRCDETRSGSPAPTADVKRGAALARELLRTRPSVAA